MPMDKMHISGLGWLVDLKPYVYYDGPLFWAGRRSNTDEWYICASEYEPMYKENGDDDDDTFIGWENNMYYAPITMERIKQFENNELTAHQLFTEEVRDGELNKVEERTYHIDNVDFDADTFPITNFKLNRESDDDNEIVKAKG